MENKNLPSFIIDVSDNLIYIEDFETYEIYYVNKVAQKALEKVGINEWKGKKSYEILSTGKAYDGFYGEMCAGDYDGLEIEYLNKVLNRHFLLKKDIIMCDNVKCRMKIFTDITHATALEIELSLKVKEQELLHTCVELLHSNICPDECINTILEIFGLYYHAERSTIFMLTEDGKFANNTFEWCNEGVEPHKDKMQNIPSDFGFNFNSNKGTESYNSLEIQQRLKEASPDFEVIDHRDDITFISSPLYDADYNVTGFISVYNPRENAERTSTILSVGKFIVDFIDKSNLIENLNRLSYHDILTGCKNHLSYRAKLEEYENKKPNTLGVIYIDINGLKSINNTKGHAYGDEIIKKISQLLVDLFKGSVYRIDGNEFAVLKENIEETVFEDLVYELKNRAKEDDLDISVGFSWNRVFGDTNEAISKASNSLEAGKNLVAKEYTNFLRENLMREIKNGRFMVYYQPQINLERETIVGAEALIRKMDSAGNILAPFAFIPFYEKQEIISLVDFFVLEEVCKLLQETGENYLKISVNFSRVTFFEKDVVSKTMDICQKYGVPAEQITVEVTETIQGLDQEILVSTINEFLSAGFSLSLDDFGSGYSNMALIASANFREIKIDKSLVDGIVSNDKSRVLARLVISACDEFKNTATVAEGIETVEQYVMLRDMNCEIGQGYFFDKPLAQADFTKKYILKHLS
ncbi:MAG: bifunctional diguanylate cyclase/phosphodiesterase [Clostridia bacterium]